MPEMQRRRAATSESGQFHRHKCTFAEDCSKSLSLASYPLSGVYGSWPLLPFVECTITFLKLKEMISAPYNLENLYAFLLRLFSIDHKRTNNNTTRGRRSPVTSNVQMCWNPFLLCSCYCCLLSVLELKLLTLRVYSVRGSCANFVLKVRHWPCVGLLCSVSCVSSVKSSRPPKCNSKRPSNFKANSMHSTAV